MNIGIIGAGNVGGTLGRGWAKQGHAIMFSARDADPKLAKQLAELGSKASAGTVAETAAFGDVVVLALPWSAAQEALQSAGDLAGKVLLDCTNPIKADFSWLEFGHTTSAAEQIAAWAPGAHVVKIFNQAGFEVLADPRFGDQVATTFYCGNDTVAKATAAQLAADLGLDPVDAGPLEQARLLEAAAWLVITMAAKYGQGRGIALKLLRR